MTEASNAMAAMSTPPPTLSILIVSYNTKAMTLACLDSIVAETRATTFEIIVVDNNSPDGSAAAIAAHCANPTLIAAPENLGFAGGNNHAALVARGELLLLINPDTVVLDGAIDKLVAFHRARPGARIVGGRTRFADGRLNPSSCWGRMTPWHLLCRATGLTALFPRTTLFNGEALGGYDRSREREVDIVSGCFFLLDRAFWDKLGGFDPAFFMYGEEADLCLRAKKLGARPRVTPDATIIHHGGASEATRTGKMIKLLSAKTMLIERHWSPALIPVGRALMAAWPLSRWVMLALASRVTGLTKHATAAAVWHEIWQRRGQWMGGFEMPVATGPVSGVAARV